LWRTEPADRDVLGNNFVARFLRRVDALTNLPAVDPAWRQAVDRGPMWSDVERQGARPACQRRLRRRCGVDEPGCQRACHDENAPTPGRFDVLDECVGKTPGR